MIATPTVLIKRALGKHMLQLKLDRSANSYWIVAASRGLKPATLDNQF